MCFEDDELERRLAESFACRPGDGLGGADMHALVTVISAREDWDDLVAVRDELRRRSQLGDLAEKFRPGPHGQWSSTFNGPAWRYSFGAQIFNEALRCHSPARYAVLGLPARPSQEQLLDVAGRFAWAELDALVEDPGLRLLIARERVARGEDLREAGFEVASAEPPFYLEAWEPRTYWRPGEEVIWPTMNVARQLLPARAEIELPKDPVLPFLEGFAKDLEERASVKVQGDALQAIAALGFSRARIKETSLADMLARIAYGANHHEGHFRLTDTGRRVAWDLLDIIAGQLPGLPDVSGTQRLERAGERVRWIAFSAISDDEEVDEDGYDEYGRAFFAVEDPDTGIAWAVAARGDHWFR